MLPLQPHGLAVVPWGPRILRSMKEKGKDCMGLGGGVVSLAGRAGVVRSESTYGIPVGRRCWGEGVELLGVEGRSSSSANTNV